MKVIFNNSTLVFKTFSLNNNGLIKFTIPSGSTQYNSGLLDAGTYYFNVATTATTNLKVSVLYDDNTSGILKTITPSQFGTDVKVVVPSDIKYLYFVGEASGSYTITVKTPDTFVKLGEVTMDSAYGSNNKLNVHTTISQELEQAMAAYDDIYMKVSDSNNLLTSLNNVNSYKYQSGYTYYYKGYIFSVITKCLNKPNANVYVQCFEAMDYTGINGDTTIKVEFFRKAS